MFWDWLVHRTNWLDQEIKDTFDYYLLSYKNMSMIADTQSTEYKLAELDCLVTRNMMDTWIILKILGTPLSKGKLRVRNLDIAKVRLANFGKVTDQEFVSDLLPYPVKLTK